MEPAQLRFDFNHKVQPSPAELSEIEGLVRGWIDAGHPVTTQEMPIAAAKERGAKALFGEKYGDVVRVVDMGGPSISVELCGGCHVASTSDIGAFRLVREEASAAGIRRITAVAGSAAEALTAAEQTSIDACAQIIGLSSGDIADLAPLAKHLKAPVEELPKRLTALQTEVTELQQQVDDQTELPSGVLARVQALQDLGKRLRKAVEAKQAEAALAAVDDLVASARTVSDLPVVISAVDGADAKSLRQVAERVQQKIGGGVVVLAATPADSVVLIALASEAAIAQGAHAGQLIGKLARIVGGGGGGRPNQAQAGGKNPAALPQAFDEATKLVADMLSGT